MKVKSDQSNLHTKKKNALPTASKFVKPKMFKSSLKKTKDANRINIELVKNKHLGVIDSESEDLTKLRSNNQKLSKSSKGVIGKNGLLRSDKKSSPKLTVKKTNIIQKTQQNEVVLPMDTVDAQVKENMRKITRKGSKMRTYLAEQQKKLQDLNPLTIKPSLASKMMPSSNKTVQNVLNHSSGNLNVEKQLNINKVITASAGQLKVIEKKSDSKSGLLNLAEPVFLQVECIKIPICPTKQLRFKLPHPLVNELSDILLITADKKGSKIHPEKAVEYHEELLAKHNINFIQKVMPVRMVKQEYSQYEMRRKLVNQFDLILADANILRSLPGLLGKFICYNRKMPIPVHLNHKNLKEHLLNAMSKTQMTVKSNGHVFSVQVAHSKMDANEIAENIVEMGKQLAELFPGGWQNIRSLNLKSGNSTSIPVYMSLVSPNVIKIPVEQPKKPEPVEDELTTMPGFNVVVTSDGNVILKKVAEEELIDDSKDDEILQEAEKYIQSSKTVRYDESDEEKDSDKDAEDSDMEAEAVTAAMEQELLNNYEDSVKAKLAAGNEGFDKDEEEEEEEEESSDDDNKIIPILGKKRKMAPSKNQPGRKSPKAQHQQEKLKNPKKKDSGGMSPGMLNKDKNPKRGSRGGKKNKMSKDQRKALIKRKKAGKNLKK